MTDAKGHTDAELSCCSHAESAPIRGFLQEEYENRVARVQREMHCRDLELLWLTTEADLLYLSGFRTRFWLSPTRPWNLLLPANGKPVAVIPEIGSVAMQRTWIEDIRTWSSPHPYDDGVSLLVATMQELVGRQGVIALPMGRETHLRYPLNDLERVRRALPDCRWVDDEHLLQRVRQIKSTAEIGHLRHICQLVSRSFEQLPSILRPGMSEIELFRDFRIACLQQGADEVDYLVGAARPGGYEDIISPPTEHRIGRGDVLILDTGCSFDGYFADFDRNFAIGKVDAATAAAHQRTWDATEAGLACIAEGNASCSRVFSAMQAVLETDGGSAGKGDVGRFGHGLGIQLTETPSIAAFDDTPLQPGMVMTLEPGYQYSPGRMMVHEENLVITETGPQLLSRRAPRDIPIIG